MGLIQLLVEDFGCKLFDIRNISSHLGEVTQGDTHIQAQKNCEQSSPLKRSVAARCDIALEDNGEIDTQIIGIADLKRKSGIAIEVVGKSERGGSCVAMEGQIESTGSALWI